jgi:DNA-binding CsgD family transcriptional regulator
LFRRPALIFSAHLMETLLKNSQDALEILQRLANRTQSDLAPEQRALLEKVAIEMLMMSRSSARQLGRTVEATSGGVSLSRREAEVADWISQGLTDGEIASVLGISTRTVNTHRDNLRRKLNVRSRTAVATWVTNHRDRNLPLASTDATGVIP